jgi:hypothetical protein
MHPSTTAVAIWWIGFTLKRFVATSDMDIGYVSHLIVLARCGLILNTSSKNIPLSRNVSDNSSSSGCRNASRQRL